MSAHISPHDIHAAPGAVCTAAVREEIAMARDPYVPPSNASCPAEERGGADGLVPIAVRRAKLRVDEVVERTGTLIDEIKEMMRCRRAGRSQEERARAETVTHIAGGINALLTRLAHEPVCIDIEHEEVTYAEGFPPGSRWYAVQDFLCILDGSSNLPHHRLPASWFVEDLLPILYWMAGTEPVEDEFLGHAEAWKNY